MELFVLKIIGIISVSVVSLAIVISRKDDIGIGALVIATILELIALIIIFEPIDEWITFLINYFLK